MNGNMTPWEIKRDYMAGKNPLQMLTCLADQCGCSKKEIAEILIQEGVPMDKLPKNYRKEQAVEKAPEKEPEKKPKKEPEGIQLKLTQEDAGLMLGVLLAYINERSTAISNTILNETDDISPVLDTVRWMNKAADIAQELQGEMHKD